MIVGSKVLDCMHGRDRKVSFKEEYKMCCNDRKVSDHRYFHRYFKNYEMIQDTKKFNCSSQIKIKEVLKFPDFKIIEDSKWKRVTSSKKIRESILKNEAVGQKMFSVFLPSKSSHTGHFTGDKQFCCWYIPAN
ncbi:uncharacterized protein LOC136092250 isoform X2 [Hydra vulgaris]|uniref:Uncharacterized protein LOC136092250 isoform X2 n=1 Tax=Hydra vulgaris TaxID=6087 RepID=A0ABM4DNH1_HYDVU